MIELSIAHSPNPVGNTHQMFRQAAAIVHTTSNSGLEQSRNQKIRRGSMGDLYVWLLSFFFLITLLAIIVFQLISLADLEFDNINPYDSSSQINKVVLPEYIIAAALCLFYLLTGHWCMALLCGPFLYCNAKLRHLIDVNEIFNQLHWEKKQRLFRLGYILFLLCLSILWMILAALEDTDYD